MQLNYRLTPMMSELESRFREMADSLCAPANLIRFATSPPKEGGAHVEHLADAFAYVVTQHGRVCERKTTSDLNEILYWLISDLTSAMAREFEILNRVPHQDFRKLYFEKHLALLAAVNRDWAERKWLEYGQGLVKHPYAVVEFQR